MYNEWHEPIKKWDAHRVKDFFAWAREAYGEEPFKAVSYTHLTLPTNREV